MIPINRTYAPIQAMIDELARCGMRRAVACPGSRNAPVLLSLAGAGQIETTSVVDERAAGFMALGMAKATGLPVLLTCTSGTAAANLAPAVYEAHEARVPLLVLTADRPPELREVGAGQAIDQLRLYGSAAKWFSEVGNHDIGRASAVHHRSLACRAFWTALGGRPGPVHLNLPLREPLAPVHEDLDPADWEGRADGAPWVEVRGGEPPAGGLEALSELLAASPRAAIVCGPTREDLTTSVPDLAALGGWPVLAEPSSGLRCGRHDRSHVVAHYDVLLRTEAFATRPPDLVLRIGDTPTSKPLRAWMAGARQVVLDADATWHEPTREAELVIRAGGAATCSELSKTLPSPVRDEQWIAAWREGDALVPAALAEAPSSFEPRVAAALAETMPDGAILWSASSMPVRDVESFFPRSERSIRFLANRGANGIDGTVSSAAGAALATGAPTTVLLGDLALLHDVGGLLAAGAAGAELTVVCVNNGGGGIFDFLPVAEHADRDAFERFVATPREVDLAAAAAFAGLDHRPVSSADELAHATRSGPALVEFRTGRAEAVRLHRELYARVAARL